MRARVLQAVSSRVSGKHADDNATETALVVTPISISSQAMFGSCVNAVLAGKLTLENRMLAVEMM